MMRKLLVSAMLVAVMIDAASVQAQNGHSNLSSQYGEREGSNARPAKVHDNKQKGRLDNRWQARQEDNRNTPRQIYRPQPQISWHVYNRYDFNRPDPRYGNYYAERYYRDSNYYRTFTLSRNDRIYRGSNNRYYCRRNDGTTGLIIVGAIAGGLLGDVIAPRGSKTVGVILAGDAGGLIARAIGRDGVRCQ
jgi:hypothetical protein